VLLAIVAVSLHVGHFGQGRTLGRIRPLPTHAVLAAINLRLTKKEQQTSQLLNHHLVFLISLNILTVFSK
jgi:hypothetical protein